MWLDLLEASLSRVSFSPISFLREPERSHLPFEADARLRGIVRALEQEMLKRYQARGVRKVRTMVDAAMPDVEMFFTRLGFEPDTLRPYCKDLGTSPGART